MVYTTRLGQFFYYIPMSLLLDELIVRQICPLFPIFVPKQSYVSFSACFFYLSVCVSFYICLCVCIYLFVCLYISVCVFLFITLCLSIYLSVCLCLSIYLSVCVFLHRFVSFYICLCMSLLVYCLSFPHINYMQV